MPGKRKTPQDSLTVLTDTVLPGETNAINNLFLVRRGLLKIKLTRLRFSLI